MYKITDVVEMGHLKFIGGTMTISLTFNDFVNPEPYYDVIDYLDHCLVTDDPQATLLSSRHFLLDKCQESIVLIHILRYLEMSCRHRV